MAGIDEASFMKRLSAGKGPPPSDNIPGEAEPDGDEAPLSCGEQLMKALDSGDASAVDDALREAVKKYGGGGY